MRTGDRTLEGNTELQWYLPANSVAHDATTTAPAPVGVLRQTLQKQAVAGRRTTRCAR